MTTTYTLLNQSAEADESVITKPFNRAAWGTRTASVPAGIFGQTVNVVAGEEIGYPLLRVVTIKPAQVFHPDQAGAKMAGRRYELTIHTAVMKSDDVSGLSSFIPVSAQIAINHGGNEIIAPEDTLDLLLSAIAQFYPSVSAGDPSLTNINRLAQGATNLA